VKRVLKVGLVLGLVGLLGMGAWFGGEYAVYRLRASSYDPPQRFTLARVHPEFGPGAPTNFQTARVVRDQVEVVVSIGSCDAVTGLDVRETSTEVHVVVESSRLPGDCTADVKSVFVYVPLEEPLGDRELIDDESGDPVEVATCGPLPEPRSGICSPGWYGY
jgi:hypothetical protein